MWGKLSNTQRFILIGVVVLTIVDLIMWANVAKLKNPFSRFEDALNAGNAKKAVECYQQMQKPSQKKNRSEAEKLGIKYAKIRVGTDPAEYQWMQKRTGSLQSALRRTQYPEWDW